MKTKHTPGLTRDQVLAIAEKYGEFQFGDAQGDKRIAYAAEVIEARERIRDAAPDLLDVVQRYAAMDRQEGRTDNNLFRSAVAAIAKATGETR